jgi:pSer/pThr/pTyr-binding forkhead associated (FHA) protein
VGLPATSQLIHIIPAGAARVLGRSSRCDLVVKDPTVSRRHAELAVRSVSIIRVTDLDSRNGTFVDGVRVREAEVTPGRLVRFGGVAFLVSVFGSGGGDENSGLATDTPPPGSPRAQRVADGLTPAQRRVFTYLVDGIVEKRIAAILGLSRHTVHNHVRAIYRAFEVQSRPELLARLVRDRPAH